MFLATKTLYLSLVRFDPSFVTVVYCSLSVLFVSVNKSLTVLVIVDCDSVVFVLS